jgi:betaine reductase
MVRPVLLAAATVLAHAPGMVPLGSRPSRQIARDPALIERIRASSRSYEDAVAYAPNQAFIGAIHPRAMGLPPHAGQRVAGAGRFAATGEIMPEEELFGLIALADHFKHVMLTDRASRLANDALAAHPLGPFFASKLAALPSGDCEPKAASGALAIRFANGDLAGTIEAGHDEDASLTAEVLAENLACKATGALALAHLLGRQTIDPAQIDFVISCSEEAVGDRYQRGGGNLGKAIAEMTGCVEASGADVKNFCAAPIPAMVIAASMVAAGVFRRVAVVGGGSLPKLGMKYEGHLKHEMPILEDVLGGVAAVIGEDDGISPVVRLDSVGRHRVRAGSSAEAIMDELVTTPLARLGLRMTDVDQYATELHNPELTEPQGGGNVPERNYRMLAAIAVRRGLIGRDDMAQFVAERGMPGFAPTQGHIASAFCYVEHARRSLIEKSGVDRIMMLAKGSLFLGMMTGQSDGMSFLLERNRG